MVNVLITKVTGGYEVRAGGDQYIYWYPSMGRAQKKQRELLETAPEIPPAPSKPKEIIPQAELPLVTPAVVQTLDSIGERVHPTPEEEDPGQFDRYTNGSDWQTDLARRLQAIKARKTGTAPDPMPGELRISRQQEA